MRVIIKFKYTEKEYVKAVREYLIASDIISKSSIVIVPIIFVLSIMNIVLIDKSVLSLIVLMIFGGLLFRGLTLYFYAPEQNFEVINKYGKIYNLEFNNKELYFTIDSMDSDLEMKMYKEIWESENFFFLIHSRNIYAIIPKRILRDSNHKKKFNVLINKLFKDIKKI